MLNELGITSGARKARIFMDLLRESVSADFPNLSIYVLAILVPGFIPSLFNNQHTTG